MIAAPIPLVRVATASRVLVPQYGGYDFKFVDGEPDHKYICAICTLVSRDPQQVTCCYNTFCNTCLQRLEQHEQHRENSKCPMCKKPLQYFPDGKLNREIIALKIHCTNSEEGCKWKGTINETGTSIDTHLNSCPYQLVPCTNGCVEKIRRSLLETHLTNNCPKRMVNCQYCKRKGAHNLITSRIHLNECPDLPIQCSNEGCNEKIPRCSLASHKETCPKAIIQCEYNTVGCNKKMKREEQEIHNEESTEVHLQLTNGRLQLTKEKLEEATETIKSLKTTLEQKNPLIASNEVFKISQFTKKKKENEKWYSPGFYTSTGGYKMSLRVDPNGHGEGEGTRVSCFICLEAGEYDDTLEWPFQGDVTIELLNQLEDKNHRKSMIRYDRSTPDECKERVTVNMSPEPWGIHSFISHKELDHNSFSRCQYLKDDNLYFRVSASITSKAKRWLVNNTRIY